MQKGCEVKYSYRTTAPHLNSCVEAPTSCDGICSQIFGRFRRGGEDGALMMGFAPREEETPRACFLSLHLHTPKRPCEYTARRWPFATQGESLLRYWPHWHHDLGLPHQYYESKFLVCGILLWHPKLPKMETKTLT